MVSVLFDLVTPAVTMTSVFTSRPRILFKKKVDTNTSLILIYLNVLAVFFLSYSKYSMYILVKVVREGTLTR